MDERYLFALRKIALIGGKDDYVALSSRELGDVLEMSQQSASKRILGLLEEKLIVRDLGARKQRIMITPKGVEALKSEYNEYRRVFEPIDHVLLHGIVTSGMGEGGYYICQPQYMVQFEQILGAKPFEGTFNITVNKDDLNKLEIIRGSAGHLVNGFTSEGRSFGNVIVYEAMIKNIECAIVVPERSHYKEVLEIICQYHLRRTLSLNDGDPVDIKIRI